MSLPIQPQLESDHLVLRPLKESDFPDLFAASSDPLIWEQHPKADRYKKEVFLEFFAGAMASRGALAIIDRASGVMIGSSLYYDVDPIRMELAIGFTFLKKAYWGGAYNRELKTLMLQHAFQTCACESVIFHVGEFNLRSQKALLKIGAVKDGQLKREGDAGAVTLLYRIHKKDFEAQ